MNLWDVPDINVGDIWISVFIRLCIRKGITLLKWYVSKAYLWECGINERMKWSGTRECS